MKHYKFKYDGKGINDATNQYKPRIATLAMDYNQDETLCNILENAPDMLALLQSLQYAAKSGQCDLAHLESHVDKLITKIMG